MKKKANVYIDGQNFFYGLKNLDLNPWYFDFKRYATNELVTNPELELQQIKYYGARYPKSICEKKHNRDDAFYKSLAENQGIVIREGTFKINELKYYGKTKKVPTEKGVDVLLATDLIIDAFHSCYDVAYILSSDTDIIPAIKEIKKAFPNIRINNFSFNKLQQYKNACDYTAKIFPNKAKRYINSEIFQPTSQTLQDLVSKFSK